jgi:hypothetical protein
MVQSMTVHVDECPHDPAQGSVRPLLHVDTGPVETVSDLDMDPAMPILPIRSASPMPVSVQTAAPSAPVLEPHQPGRVIALSFVSGWRAFSSVSLFEYSVLQ